MLGWFKKKFKKQEVSPSRPEETTELEPEIEEELTGEQPERVEEQSPEEESITPGEPGDVVAAPEPEESPEAPETPEKEPETLPEEPETEEETEAAEPAPGPVEEEPAPSAPAPPPPSSGKGSVFKRLSARLSKTKETLVYRMDTLFLGKKEIDAELFDELEEIMITADLGISTTMELLDDARKRVKRKELSDPALLKGVLKEKLRSFIMESDRPAELVMPESGPFVIMVVGVNGVGKTTSIGKITNKFKKSGQSVLLVAADTFRAAAVAQLKIWGERNDVEVVAQNEGADPSAVVYDAMGKAVAKEYDVVIVDTAGRLHTQVNLMEELKKIKRVMGKLVDGAPHEVMLVLDATTGQNAVSQAKLFNETVAVSGLTLTKLDGTAKGGIVANICHELQIPIRFIGIGEQIDDLRDFDPDEFIDALFAEEKR